MSSLANASWYDFTIPSFKITASPTMASTALIVGGGAVAVLGAGLLIPAIGIAAGTGSIASTMIGSGILMSVDITDGKAK
jgi:hypothetical protein